MGVWKIKVIYIYIYNSWDCFTFNSRCVWGSGFTRQKTRSTMDTSCIYLQSWRKSTDPAENRWLGSGWRDRRSCHRLQSLGNWNLSNFVDISRSENSHSEHNISLWTYWYKHLFLHFFFFLLSDFFFDFLFIVFVGLQDALFSISISQKITVSRVSFWLLA